MHTTTISTAALPGGRKPLRARNAAIAALGIVSAVMVAVGVAIGGGKPVPPHTPTISPSSLGRPGVVEVRFGAKPAPEVLAGLKAHDFRRARGNRCWNGRNEAYARSLVG